MRDARRRRRRAACRAGRGRCAARRPSRAPRGRSSAIVSVASALPSVPSLHAPRSLRSTTHARPGPVTLNCTHRADLLRERRVLARAARASAAKIVGALAAVSAPRRGRRRRCRRRRRRAPPSRDLEPARIDLLEELELLRRHHVAADLQLAAEVELLRVGLAGVMRGSPRRRARACSRPCRRRACADRALAVLQVEHPRAVRARELELEDRLRPSSTRSGFCSRYSPMTANDSLPSSAPRDRRLPGSRRRRRQPPPPRASRRLDRACGSIFFRNSSFCDAITSPVILSLPSKNSFCASALPADHVEKSASVDLERAVRLAAGALRDRALAVLQVDRPRVSGAVSLKW